MNRKIISFGGIALFFIIMLIILNLIGLKFYKSEIDDHLKKSMIREGITFDSLSQFTAEEINQKFGNKLAESINDHFASKQSHNDHIDQLASALNTSFNNREEAYNDYKCECDGTCGNGKVGRGSECARKEKKYLQLNNEYQELKAQYESAKNSASFLIQEEKIQNDIEVFLQDKIESSWSRRVKAFWQVIF